VYVDLMDCIFCKIISGDAPATFLLQSYGGVIIKPIDPIAPVHALVIPRRHVTDLTELGGGARDDNTLPMLFQLAHMFVTSHGLDKTGYRVVFNTGTDAKQTVPHLHMHVVGGGPLAHAFA
jgi:histidine triad (HIT) family protein